MERWRVVWRKGFSPSLPTAGLEALRRALLADDPRLQQGRATTPPASPRFANAACEAACALGFCGWQGLARTTAAAVDEFVNQVCWEADVRLNEATACRWFLNWFDSTPRPAMRRSLLAEVDWALEQRTRPSEPRRPVQTHGMSELGMAAVWHSARSPAPGEGFKA